MLDLTQIIIGLVVVSLLLGYANLQWGSPLVGLFNRWMRWIVFSSLLASIAVEFEWTYRPFWLVAFTAFLGWFLLETIYNWIIISALSHSPIPLFPKFRPNSGKDEWPAMKKFIMIRDWLRSNSYKKLQSVKADIEDLLSIRSTIYQNEDSTVRLQVLFFPQRGAGNISVCYILSSQLEDGRRLITDNVFMPFGGFYPENWHIERKPLIHSLERLIKIHQRRIRGEALLSFDDEEPLQDLNKEQSLLERINFESGFLLPYDQHEEHGRLTWEGRYRIWKEIWLLNYFGISLS